MGRIVPSSVPVPTTGPAAPSMAPVSASLGGSARTAHRVSCDPTTVPLSVMVPPPTGLNSPGDKNIYPRPIYLFALFLYVWCVSKCHSMYVEVRGQLYSITSLLPLLYGSQGSNSGSPGLGSKCLYPLSQVTVPRPWKSHLVKQ